MLALTCESLDWGRSIGDCAARTASKDERLRRMVTQDMCVYITLEATLA
jgi:hypothetical protein